MENNQACRKLGLLGSKAEAQHLPCGSGQIWLKLPVSLEQQLQRLKNIPCAGIFCSLMNKAQSFRVTVFLMSVYI